MDEDYFGSAAEWGDEADGGQVRRAPGGPHEDCWSPPCPRRPRGHRVVQAQRARLPAAVRPRPSGPAPHAAARRGSRTRPPRPPFLRSPISGGGGEGRGPAAWAQRRRWRAGASVSLVEGLVLAQERHEVTPSLTAGFLGQAQCEALLLASPPRPSSPLPLCQTADHPSGQRRET